MSGYSRVFTTSPKSMLFALQWAAPLSRKPATPPSTCRNDVTLMSYNEIAMTG